MATRETLLRQIRDERERWQALLDEVGEERMEEPGLPGGWTFKDLTAHLTGWRQRTVTRLEAGPGTEPAPPWPVHLTDDDEINDWIYAENHDRPLRDVLDDAEQAFDRLETIVTALDEEDVVTPGRFHWLEGKSLADTDFFDHLRDEHQADLRAWLAGR